MSSLQEHSTDWLDNWLVWLNVDSCILKKKTKNGLGLVRWSKHGTRRGGSVTFTRAPCIDWLAGLLQTYIPTSFLPSPKPVLWDARTILLPLMLDHEAETCGKMMTFRLEVCNICLSFHNFFTVIFSFVFYYFFSFISILPSVKDESVAFVLLNPRLFTLLCSLLWQCCCALFFLSGLLTCVLVLWYYSFPLAGISRVIVLL